VGEQTLGASHQVFIFDGVGGTVYLDDERMRKVIVQNSVIEYDGGPLLLENVYFVNCTFDIRETPKDKQLGTSILASAEFVGSPTKGASMTTVFSASKTAT